MSKIETLKQIVRELYEARNPNRDEWADWLYASHVFQVAQAARNLAVRFHADPDLAEAAGILHDVADAVMSREDPEHEKKSLAMAHDLLTESVFTDEEIAIVEDGLKYHSCHGDALPQTLEGRVMATADAVVHLTTDFYPHWLHEKLKTHSIEEFSEHSLEKIERDYHVKIFFPEVREEVRAAYEKAKGLFT